MEQNTTAVSTTGLTKTYDGIDRVRNLDLEIRKGEIYGFLGPNGAGKSTTMKMLLGLSRPSAGETEILGTTLNDKTRPEILSRVGSIIESPSYYGHLSASENMKIIETLLDLPEGRGDRALRIVRLYDQKDRRVREFSLGMKQRLAIAMALARNPELLILDEPVDGLDFTGTEFLYDATNAYREYGSVLMSSHIAESFERCCDQLDVMRSGALEGPITDPDALRHVRRLVLGD